MATEARADGKIDCTPFLKAIADAVCDAGKKGAFRTIVHERCVRSGCSPELCDNLMIALICAQWLSERDGRYFFGPALGAWPG